MDGSPTSNAGLDEAIQLAQLTHAHLRLLHVVDEMPFIMGADYTAMSGDVLGLLKEAGQEILRAAASKVERGGVAVDIALLVRAPASEQAGR